jgi:hypothetical protein
MGRFMTARFFCQQKSRDFPTGIFTGNTSQSQQGDAPAAGVCLHTPGALEFFGGFSREKNQVFTI